MQNFIFISPNFPTNYWKFCRELKNNGIRVMGIGDQPWEEMTQELKDSLNEYYKVSSLENYDEVYRAVAWFAHKYGKRQGFDFVWLVDHLSIAVCFAATFIRLGNLFNSEIYGGVTNLPWGFVFVRNEETEPHHPTQLYEALSYLILGLVLLAIYKYRSEKTWRGTFIGLFLIGCFGSRFLIEFIKNDQVDFEAGMALNMGQILSIPFVLLGIGFLVYAYKKKLPALVDGGFQKLETKKRK